MNAIIQRIKAVLPEPVTSYQVIKHGWTYRVVEVNSRWIFRFVRHPDNTQLLLEQAFLPRFAPAAPLDIPRPVLSGSDFIAYPRISGERFGPETFAQLTPTQRTATARTLAAFLTRLHTFPFSSRYLSEAPYGGADFWHDLWPPVGKRLSPRARANARRFFETALARVGAVSYARTLTHSDLGTNNVLFNAETGRLGGIIDFGDLARSDPAVDFAGFFRHFGRPFVMEIMRHYQRPLERNFWDRVQFQARRKAFFVVHYALNYGFEQHVAAIIDGIERTFYADEGGPW